MPLTGDDKIECAHIAFVDLSAHIFKAKRRAEGTSQRPEGANLSVVLDFVGYAENPYLPPTACVARLAVLMAHDQDEYVAFFISIYNRVRKDL